MENTKLLSEHSLEDLQALIKQLQNELAEKNNLIIKKLEEIEQLRHQLNRLLQDKFGTKSEKSKNLEENTFNEATLSKNSLEIETDSFASLSEKESPPEMPTNSPLLLSRIQHQSDESSAIIDNSTRTSISPPTPLEDMSSSEYAPSQNGNKRINLGGS